MLVKFTELEFDSKEVLHPSKRVPKPWPISWTRIEIEIPDFWEAPGKIEKWVEKNVAEGEWDWFIRQESTAGSSWSDSHIMVLGFEKENDALMFKLSGGSEAWETQE